MKSVFISLISIIIFLSSNAQIKHATGLLFDPEKYKKIETVSPALKFSDVEKSSYSIKEYCPTPGNQGSIGSCTSWASGYAALTISYAIQNEITNTNEITNNAKSALYIFNQIKSGSCSDGAYVENALKLIKQKGDCDYKDFHPNDCQIVPSSIEDNKAQLFKILEYNTLFNLSANYDQKISSTINSLNANKPVVIGLNLRASFETVSKNGKYTPRESEKNIGGHALCVIGYDNINKEFEIINSWGTGWGNNGFFKISYNDYSKYCQEAYQFTLDRNKTINKTTLKGDFQILKFIGTDPSTQKNRFNTVTPFFSSDNCYHINEHIKKDDFFRIRAMNLVKDSYVYIFSYKPNKTAEILFPVNYRNNGSTVDIPLITASNVSIELPQNTDNAYSADQVGDDMLCILYSNKRIDNLDTRILEIKNYNGDIWSWLKNNFKNELFTTNNLTYNTFSMGVTTNQNSNGSIVPLILKVSVQ